MPTLKDENRDVSKASKKIYDVIDEGAKSDITLDTRFLTSDGLASIGHDLQNTNKLIMEAIPDLGKIGLSAAQGPIPSHRKFTNLCPHDSE